MGACDMHGFIMDACEIVQREDNHEDDNPFHGTIDTNRFEMWIEQKLLPILGNYHLQEPCSLVILDNASIHHSEKVVEMIESVGAKVLFSAPFSPEFNPIVNMFGEYKKGLK